MRTKSAVVFVSAAWAAGALLLMGRPLGAATPPTLVLYPRTPNNPDDVRALVDLRKKLRSDGQFVVLTYDPEAAAMVRAARDAGQPQLLSGPMSADRDRLSLTRALGAAFYAVVSKADGRGKADVHLVEAAPSARVWDIADKKTDDAARAVEQESGDALLHPLALAVAPPAPPRTALPVAVLPKPTPPAPVAAPSPPVKVSVVPAPSIVVPPVQTPSVTVSRPAVPTPVVPMSPPVQMAAPPAAPTAPRPAPPVEVLVPVPKAAAPAPPTEATVVAPSSLPIPAPATVPKAILPSTPVVVAAPGASPVPTLPAPVKVPETIIAPSVTPIPAPATVTLAPPAAVAPAPAAPAVEDLSAVASTLRQGDNELARGNFVGAIARYRESINGAPLSPTPRLKLAQAYLAADMRDKALDEAKRALEVAPDSPALQQFLTQLDAQSGSADGAVARFSALVSQSPQDPAAHLELGDAFWNNSALTQAEDEYRTAQSLAGAGTPTAQTAAAHLARLYAAQMRYGDSLTSLKDAGPAGYALALGIVQSRADTLSSTLETAQDSFSAGKTTHADFYKAAGDVSVQAQALADFVIKVAPPPAFKLSHLYRIQATHLLAQQAATLVTYIETSDPARADKAAQLGKEAQTEMLTAHAAEQKLGLWGGKQAEAKS